MYFVGRQEAEVEVLIDRIVTKEGNKDKALLYVVSEIDNENKVCSMNAYGNFRLSEIYFNLQRKRKRYAHNFLSLLALTFASNLLFEEPFNCPENMIPPYRDNVTGI